jgi:regulator of sirC expression with transglutaminase-like and TPR domain
MFDRAAMLTHPDPWRWLCDADDTEVSLLDASLLIAKDEYPALDVMSIRRQFAQLAKAADLAADGHSGALARLKSLNHFLFDTQGFTGNFLDYYNPRNSYLNDVLERKLGIPISLAVIYIELGRHLGVELAGVSFPGHFLVRVPVEGGLIIIDPFNRGKSIGADELKFRASSSGEAAAPSEDELFQMLAPCDNKTVLIRMLNNLKSLYRSDNDHLRALRVGHRLVQLTGSVYEQRDRGLMYLEIGARHSATSDLKAYLSTYPNARDASEIRLALLTAQSAPKLN